MTTLTVTSKGQVTLRKDLLRHIGVSPGGKISVESEPNAGSTFTIHVPAVAALAHSA